MSRCCCCCCYNLNVMNDENIFFYMDVVMSCVWNKYFFLQAKISILLGKIFASVMVNVIKHNSLHSLNRFDFMNNNDDDGSCCWVVFFDKIILFYAHGRCSNNNNNRQIIRLIFNSNSIRIFE